MHVRVAYYWLGFGSEKRVTGIAAASSCVCVCVSDVSAPQSVLLAIV